MSPIITTGFITAAKFANPTLNAPALQNAADKWDIGTPRRVTAWLAMLGVESAGLTTMSEDLYYSSADWLHQVFPSHFASAAAALPYTKNPVKLGNLVYAALGPAEGGYAARGLGWGQLTGDDNQGRFGTAVGKSLHDVRAYMQMPIGAADSAGWFFHVNGCAVPADADDLLGVRRLWTGTKSPRTPLGMAEAIKWHAQCVAALGGATGAAPPAPVAHTAPATGSPAPSDGDRLNQAEIDGFGQTS